MDRTVSHFPTLPSPPYFPVLPFSLATLSSRMLMSTMLTTTGSHKRFALIGREQRNNREWVASHKRRPLHIRHYFPWLPCTHIVREASSQAVCETYVTSSYTITEYSVKKTVNMHGTGYSETTYSTTLASGDCMLPAVEQKFTVTMCVCVCVCVYIYIYISGHSLRPIFLHDVTVRNTIKW
jgi:hypothetical protein